MSVPLSGGLHAGPGGMGIAAVRAGAAAAWGEQSPPWLSPMGSGKIRLCPFWSISLALKEKQACGMNAE